MKVYLFYHSIISDWNHGNAHFLRGLVSSLMIHHHDVVVMEPHQGWSLDNLLKNHGLQAVHDFNAHFPHHRYEFYDADTFEPSARLEDADLVLVHEWNSHKLISDIGEYRAANPHFRLFFHDTHHRSVTQPEEMQKYDLQHYDGVLAFGEVISNIYRKRERVPHVWTWHEAADTSIFYPRDSMGIREGDLVWIGNWGDEERTRELTEFIIEPVRQLKLKAVFYGVRYPDHALELLKEAGIEYRGWLPNYKVPEVFSRFRFTVHVPRRPYVESLPGIPTIRPFEAMACGIPLLSSWWDDSEKLFHGNKDFLMARNGKEMTEMMKQVLEDQAFSAQLKNHALKTIQQGHTCNHRLIELDKILGKVEGGDKNLHLITEEIIKQ